MSFEIFAQKDKLLPADIFPTLLTLREIWNHSLNRKENTKLGEFSESMISCLLSDRPEEGLDASAFQALVRELCESESVQ